MTRVMGFQLAQNATSSSMTTRTLVRPRLESSPRRLECALWKRLGRGDVGVKKNSKSKSCKRVEMKCPQTRARFADKENTIIIANPEDMATPTLTSSQNNLTDPLDLENWYSALEPYTFPTRFLDLSEREAQAIVAKYDEFRFGSKSAAESSDTETVLAQLTSRLQEHFDSLGGPAFVKLSTRSPKDIILKSAKTKRILDEELRALGEDPAAGDQGDSIKQVIALIRCCSKSLRAENAAEAVDSFTRSERIFQDLTRRLVSHNGAQFSMKVVIRKWIDIVPEYEFRGFVSRRKLTGLTQYYKACYVPDMPRLKSAIEAKINTLFELIKPFVVPESYVVDFAVVGGGIPGSDPKSEMRAYLIELNHWGKTASSSLFDWSVDHAVLHDGPFEFRILEAPPPNVKQLIARPLRALLGWSKVEEVSTLGQQKITQTRSNCTLS